MSIHSLTADFVSVFIYGCGKARAECSCGYEGKLRWTRGRAIIDALLHAWDTGCREGWPLVFRHRGPLPVSARRRSPWWAWTTAAGMIIGSALYFGAATAHADIADDYAAKVYPVICKDLADQPYVSTVENVVQAVVDVTGESYEFAGAVVGVAVRDYCPWNRGVVERFIAKYVPTAPVAPLAPISGGIGGRI